MTRPVVHKVARAFGLRSKPPPRAVAYLSDLAAGQAEVAKLSPAIDLDAPPPGGVPFDLSDPANSHFPGAYVARLPGGGVAAHGVVSADGTLIGELSIEADVRPEQVARHSLLRRPSLPRRRRLDGTAIAVVNAYCANYYHWIIEVVPRLDLVRRHLADDLKRGAPILLNRVSEPFQTETLEHLGLAASVRDTKDGSYAAAELVVPSLAGISIHPPPWACMAAREALAGLASGGGSTLRLYLSREGAGRRRVLNEPEVVDALGDLGFVVIHPEQHTVAEQVDLFSRAEAVVSAHGAGLVNTLFCPPDARVVELVPPEQVVPCYWLIARHLGLRYEPLVADPLPADASDPADQVVDVLALRRIFDPPV